MKAAKRFKTQKKERVRAKSSWQGRKTDEKEQKSVLRKKLLMHHLKVILTLLLKNISSEIIHADVVVNAINDEVSSISSISSISAHIAEQIFPESVLSEESKPINSVMSKRQGNQGKLSFLEEKGLRKIEN